MKKMKNLSILATAAVLVVAAGAADAQFTTPRPSPKGVVTQAIGLTDVTVTYSRPGVKGRAIWGDLVPYDKVWRTGANEATTIAFADDVTVGGQKLPAGTYSLHTIPGKTEWTFIFNKDAKQWGSYSYDEKQDVLRVKAKPEMVATSEEWMEFEFENLSANGADLTLKWEKLRVAVPIQVDTNAKVLATGREAAKKAETDAWQVPLRVGGFVLDSKGDLNEALAMAEKSIKARETFQGFSLKARVLAEQGKKDDAVAAADKALKVAATQEPKPNDEVVKAFEKTAADWKAKK